ncbi:cation channel sperm-associated protein subunit beta [Echinops telfairi]|uniref:Cation channel sperm-associated protein subunit beta n=1 Tax=Echinops telfairi TaxID=9371 RepID=A0ABM0ZPG9_ECHTE|nr:cation channel sperm-associated protein subunit beta [Echinops telfairi]
MEFPLFCVVILCFHMFGFSSGAVDEDDENKRYFACSSEGYHKMNKMFKLYLTSSKLTIQCFFLADRKYTSQGVLSTFTSGGLAPSLEIINSTYTGIFHFNLTLFSDQVFWSIDIPRENITKMRAITSIEEWLVRVSLHHGLNLYATEGTLLDIIREPILQWKLGVVMNRERLLQVLPHVTDVKVTKCPCANDVALLGFIVNATYNGIYLGFSFSGFWEYGNTTWYNLTESIYSQLEQDLPGLSIVDMVLTNNFLVLLTSLGLFVSADLRFPSASLLTFSRADFCGFERTDYIRGKLWYNEHCFANREMYEVDYITITFDRNRTLSEASVCFYSDEPFIDWLPCIPHSKRTRSVSSEIITFLVDLERKNGVYFLSSKVGLKTFVSVNTVTNNLPSMRRKFPAFYFPSSFSDPMGLVFHPRSNFIYAYGNQIWLSIDGGNTFDIIADFHDDVIKKTFHSFYTGDITFVSQKGKVYLTKAGLVQYTEIGAIHDKIFTLYYDHLGFIHKLTPYKFDADKSFSAMGSSKAIFHKSFDIGFESPLALQYISLSQVMFYAYVPPNEPAATKHTKEFTRMHFGKVLFPRCLSLIQVVKYTSGIDSVFQDSDLQKTVVIPGYSSFLITAIVDNITALAVATVPERAPLNSTITRWLLFNFGIVGGRQWTIYPRKCNYWYYQYESGDQLPSNVERYLDLGKGYSFKTKIVPTLRALKASEVPLMQISVGNPALLDTTVLFFFDNADSYELNVTMFTRFLLRGTSTLSITLLEASTDCFTASFLPIIKTSCSYLRFMYHVPSQPISEEALNSGNHTDEFGFNMIKTLPVNYRPPSKMGIAIPITDHFYHADPSQPIPRNLFQQSKNTGKFKQCAAAASRKECNCTNDQKLSHAVAFSDCKENVPRFKFPVQQYPVSLQIFTRSGSLPVEIPYLVTVTEVNKRENWVLKHSTPPEIAKLQAYLKSSLNVPVYNPEGLNISIRGAELFHFKVSVVPGLTFCNLVEEFQIYVDQVPLPFPGHTLIAIAAAILLGGFVFVVFMFQLHNIHPWEMCRKKCIGEAMM